MVLFINRRTRCILLEVPNKRVKPTSPGTFKNDMDARGRGGGGWTPRSGCVRTGFVVYVPLFGRTDARFVGEASGTAAIILDCSATKNSYDRCGPTTRWLPHVLEGPHLSGHSFFGRRRGSWAQTAAASGPGDFVSGDGAALTILGLVALTR